jgi:hypothetical protein
MWRQVVWPRRVVIPQRQQAEAGYPDKVGEEEPAAHRHQDTTELSTVRTRSAIDMPCLIPHRHRQPGGRFATVELPEAVGFRDLERFEEASNFARPGVDFCMAVCQYLPRTNPATGPPHDIAPILATRAAASGFDASGHVPSRGSQPS